MRIVLMTCVLAAAACSASETRPAQDPSTTSAAVSVDTSTTTPEVRPDTRNVQAPGITPATGSASVTGGYTSSANGAPSVNAADAQLRTPPSTVASPSLPISAGSAAYANGASNMDADNTKMNARDRQGGALTPMSQGNSKDELRITATIRKGLMSDGTLSTTAKNVKIITVGSKVTLRGPVKSLQERDAIEARAKQVDGVTDVDNQIEVK